LPNNVEIKARITDVEDFERRVARLADGPPQILDQRDTFFTTSHGRLKLRELGDGSGELIYYRRPDQPGPATSEYHIARTAEATTLSRVLTDALGVRGLVCKQRRLYMRGQTRIHIDRVEGLGRFMELEVVLHDRQSPGEGRAIAESLMRELEIEPRHLVDVAYIDLLVGPPSATGEVDA